MGRLLVFTLLLLCPYEILAEPQKPPANKEKADVDTLEQVNVIWRHGARLPATPTFLTNPYSNLTDWKHIGDDWGSLTLLGRQQQFELGKFIRRRYDVWLSSVYQADEIYVQSSDIDRAIMSAQSNMAGLWPVSEEDPKSQWHARMRWQPIPSRPIPSTQDDLIANYANCRRLDEIFYYYTAKSSFMIYMNEKPENVELFSNLSDYAGQPVTSLFQAAIIYDTLSTQVTNGFVPPDWAKEPLFPTRLRELMAITASPKVLVPTIEAKKLWSGRLLTVILRNMEARVGISPPDEDTDSRAKMQAYSGHDLTIAPLLGTLGVFDSFFQQPPLASAVFMELHKATPDQMDNDQDPDHHVIRLFYRNTTSEHPFEIEIPRCGYPCVLTTFKTVFHDILITKQQLARACIPKSANYMSYSDHPYDPISLRKYVTYGIH